MVERRFLNERMRKARLEKKMSQKTLSDATLFAPSTISSFEKGVTNPSERAILTIAQHLGKRPEYFTDEQISEEESNLAGKAETEPRVIRIEPVADGIALHLEICRVLVKSKEYEAALQQLNEIDLSTASSSQQYLIQFLKAQAFIRINVKERETKKARELLRTLTEELRELNPPASDPSLAQVYFEIAVSYYMDQQFEEAINYYYNVLKVLGTETDSNLLGFRTYAELGRTYRLAGNLADSARFYEKANNHVRAKEDKRQHAHMLLGQSLQLVNSQDLGEAKIKLDECVRLYEELELVEDARTVASYLNVVRAELGDQPEEIALPTAFKPENEVIIMVNQAAVLRLKSQKGDPALLEESLAQMRITLKFLQAHAKEIRPTVAADIYLEEAKLEVALNNQEAALEAFDKALEALRQPSSNARWNTFERLYDEYEKVLIEWGRDTDLARMSRQRYEDKRNSTR